MTDVQLSKNDGQDRYEAHMGQTLAGFIDYRLRDGVLTLPHTEVDDAFGGQGIGSKLARFALDDARQQGYTVRPSCPFIATWIEKHPDYQDLVAH